MIEFGLDMGHEDLITHVLVRLTKFETMRPLQCYTAVRAGN